MRRTWRWWLEEAEKRGANGGWAAGLGALAVSEHGVVRAVGHLARRLFRVLAVLHHRRRADGRRAERVGRRIAIKVVGLLHWHAHRCGEAFDYRGVDDVLVRQARRGFALVEQVHPLRKTIHGRVIWKTRQGAAYRGVINAGRRRRNYSIDAPSSTARAHPSRRRLPCTSTYLRRSRRRRCRLPPS